MPRIQPYSKEETVKRRLREATTLAAIPTDFVNAAQSAARASADTGALATGLALSRCA